MRTIVRLLPGIAALFLLQSGALGNLTNTWPFTVSSEYQVSNSNLLEVADGVAKLKLLHADIHIAAMSNYLASGVVVSNLSIGPDTSIKRTSPYSYPSVFTSRIIDGGQGNIWRRIHSPIYADAGQNAGGSIASNTLGLVACYRMDNSWIEAVSQTMPTVGSGASFTNDAKMGSHAGRFGGGAQDYILDSRSKLLNGVTEYSVACWIKPSVYVSSGIIAAQQPLAIGLTLLNVDATKVAFYANNLNIASPSGAAPLNQWSFVVGTWTSAGGAARLYINGVLVASGSIASGQTLNQGGNWYISGVPAGYRFNGKVDDAYLFSRALSENEVVALYKAPKSVLFQVRSGDTSGDLLSRSFVGPDGSPATYYTGKYESLSTIGDFKVFERYVQYRAYMYGPARLSDEEAFVDSVVFFGTPRTVADNTLNDFSQGEFTSSVTSTPVQVDSPRLGFAKLANGGYPQSGTYISPVIDAGSPVIWHTMRWGVPEEIQGGADSSILGLWHANGDWSDSSPRGHGGVDVGVSYTTLSKLGSAAAVFDGIASRVTIGGALATNQLKSLEFWMQSGRLNTPIIQLSDNTTNRMYLCISNGIVMCVGFSKSLPPQLYINGNGNYRRLLPGWNHVALISDEWVPTSEVVVGQVGASFYDGMIDELIFYNRKLAPTEIKGRLVSTVRESGGRARLQVRASDLNPIPGAVQFIGSDGTSASYFDVGAHAGALLPGSVYNRRYFQYRVVMEGDGASTPVVSSVAVTDIAASNLFVHDTWEETIVGDFGGGKTKWIGDELRLADCSAVPGLVNLEAPVVGLEGLWHCDEVNWSVGASIMDSSGNARDGTAYGGANASPIAKVGTGGGQFDGIDDYASLPSILLTGDYTYMFWFQTASSSRGAVFARSDSKVIVEMNSDGNGAVAGELTVVCQAGLESATIRSSFGGLNDGQWHHVAFASRSGRVALYVDGVPAGAGKFDPVGGLGFSDMRLFRHPGTGVFLSGRIDEVVVLSRGVVVTEIQKILGVGDDLDKEGVFYSETYDAGGPAIWELMKWRENVNFGDALVPAPSEQMVALWQVEESGGLVLLDGTGNGHDATLSGGGRSSGRFGSGLSVSAGAYAEALDGASLEPNSLTVEAWIKPTTVGDALVVDKHNGVDSGYALGIDVNGRPFFRCGDVTPTGAGGVHAGRWTHLAGTYDGSIAQLYVNGLLAGEATRSGASMGAGVLRIGAAVGGGSGFEGVIDEVVIYSRALNAREIMDHAESGAGVLRLQARSSNSPFTPADPFVGSNGTSASFFEIGTNSSMLGSLPLGRYFQFRVTLSTEDGLRSPRLQGMSLFQSKYPTDHPWVRPANGFGSSFLGKLVSFNHYMATNLDSAVRYQISGDNGTNWYWWNSGLWEPDTLGLGWLAANSAATVSNNIGTFYSQLYQARGGTFSFKAYLESDGANQTAVDWTQVVKSRGRITVIQPNGIERGEKAWVVGVPYPILWSSTGTVSGNIRIELYNLSGSNLVKVLGTNVPNTGVYTNVISEDYGSDYRVRIRDLNDATIEDWSDGDFELIQNLHISAPDGGEKWYIGETNVVRWEAPGWGGNNLGSPVWLWFSADAGTNWQVIASAPNAVGNNAYAWLTPSNTASIISENAKMGVSVTDVPDPLTSFGDISDGVFTNAGIAIVYPSAGAGIKMGNTVTIRWMAAGAGATVTLDFYDGSGWSNITASAACVPGENTYDAPLNALNPSTAARIRVSSNTDPKVWGISDPFTLADVNIVEPIGGGANRSKWQIGTSKKVKWTAGGAGAAVDIHYTVDGTNWLPIALNTPNQNSGGVVITNESPDWAIPGPPTNMARVRVRSTTQTDLYSITEPFDISGVYVVEPNGSFNDGIDWEFVATNTVKWLHQAAGGQVAVEIAYEDNPATNDYEVLYGSLSIFLGQRVIPPSMIRRPSNYARMRVRALSPPAETELLPMADPSDGPFKIKGMSIEEPHSNVVYTMGTTVPQGLQWYSASAGGTSARVYYSTNATSFPTNSFLSGLLNQDDGPAPGLNVLDFNVPRNQIPSTAARLKIAAGSYSAVSLPFTLRGIRITQPTAGQAINVGAANQAVTWAAAGLQFSARAAGAVSTSGTGGPWQDGGMSTNINVLNAGVVWNVDQGLDPTTNAVIRMSVFSPSNDTDIVMYSDAFTIRGLKVTSPAQGAVLDLGTPTTVTLLAAGMGVGARAAVYYAPDDSSFDLQNPVTNNMLVADGATTFTWNIESGPALTRMPSTNAHLMVVSGIYTNISRPFTVQGVKVTAPTRTDIWAVTDVTNIIQWVSVGGGPVYTLDFQIWSGGSVAYTEPIAAGVGGNQYVWTMTNSAVGSNVTITVRDGTYTAFSEVFEVVQAPSIRIINPRPGDFWKVGSTNVIQWSRGGNMINDFFVAYSVSPFDVTNVLRVGACDYTNGVFSLPWGPMPSTLGRTRIVVTNRVDDLVLDSFEAFDIAARFDIAPFPTDLYALETVGINWITRGDASSVDLFYSTDALRASNSWVQINTSGPYADNIGNDLPATAYPWLVPNIKTPAMWLRVQDHAYYGRLFAPDKPGPFNDFGTFPVKYYTITWHILNAATSNHLDALSVSDSSGWSAANLSSAVIHEYPYGVWDTVWFKEFFHDGVVFNWISKPSRTNVVYMSRTDTEKNIQVLADFAFDGAANRMIIHAWAQRAGLLLTDPSQCDVTVYSAAGQTLMSLGSTTPLSDAGVGTGVFRIEWNNVTNVLSYGGTYFARVSIVYSGQAYSSIVTYTLRLGMDLSMGQAILDAVNVNGTNILDVASNLNAFAAIQSMFRTNAMDRLDALTSGVANVQLGITNLQQSITAFSNQVFQSLDGIASNVAIILPKVTNIEARVDTISAIQEGTKSRILTRPDTMVYGTTNTVLYKTTPGYGGQVTIIVSNSLSGEAAVVNDVMSEVVPGLYQKDLYAAWGTNSYVITCSDPLTAPKPDWDSIVVRVGPPPLSGNTTLDSLVSDVALLQARLVNVSNMLENITNATAMLATLDGRVTWVSNQLDNVDWGAISNISGGLSLSNIYAVVTNLQVSMSSVTNVGYLTNSLASILNSVTNIQDVLGPVTNLSSVVSNLAFVNWASLTNIPGISVALTNIQATITNLSGVVGALTNLEAMTVSLTNIQSTVTNLGSLASVLGSVDWSSLSNVTALGASVTNILVSVTNMEAVVAGITNLGALADSVGTMTNALSSINWADIRNIRTGVGDLSAQLGGVDWAQMAALSSSLNQALAALQGVSGGASAAEFANVRRQIEELGRRMASGDSMDRITTQLRSFEASMAALNRLESHLGNESDTASSTTLFGRLSALESGVEMATGKSSDAAKKAASAKTEAANAVTAIRGLKDTLLTGEGGNQAGISSKIEQIREYMRQVQKVLGDVPVAKETEAISETVKTMAASIDEFSKSKGYKWLKDMKEPPGAGGEVKADGSLKREGVDELNGSIIEMRGRLEFLQKMIEEWRDKPLVEETLIGG